MWLRQSLSRHSDKGMQAAWDQATSLSACWCLPLGVFSQVSHGMLDTRHKPVDSEEEQHPTHHGWWWEGSGHTGEDGVSVAFKSPTSPRTSPLLACNLGHRFVTWGHFRNSEVHTRASVLGLLQESCGWECVIKLVDQKIRYFVFFTILFQHSFSNLLCFNIWFLKSSFKIWFDFQSCNTSSILIYWKLGWQVWSQY